MYFYFDGRLLYWSKKPIEINISNSHSDLKTLPIDIKFTDVKYEFWYVDEEEPYYTKYPNYVAFEEGLDDLYEDMLCAIENFCNTCFKKNLPDDCSINLYLEVSEKDSQKRVDGNNFNPIYQDLKLEISDWAAQLQRTKGLVSDKGTIQTCPKTYEEFSEIKY